MRISPPELVLFSRQRYISDLTYRSECDAEDAAERADRINLLLRGYGCARHSSPLPLSTCIR